MADGYTKEQSEAIIKKLQNIEQSVDKFYSRIYTATGTALQMFQGGMIGELKERVIKLENPAEQSFYIGEFIFDLITTITGAGLLKGVSRLVGIKSMNLWHSNSQIVAALQYDILRGDYKLKSGKIYQITQLLEKQLSLETKDVLDIVKGCSEEMVSTTLKKIKSYKDNESKIVSQNKTFVTSHIEIADVAGKIQDSISDAKAENLTRIRSFISLIKPDDITYPKIDEFIETYNKVESEIPFSSVSDDWKYTIFAYILSIYFHNYMLSMPQFTEEKTIEYVAEPQTHMPRDIYQTELKINPVHDKTLVDYIIVNFPSKERSFIKLALIRKGSSATEDEVIKDKALGRTKKFVQKYASGHPVTYEGSEDEILSVYDKALWLGDVWFRNLYSEFNDSSISFTKEIKNFEIKYLKK